MKSYKSVMAMILGSSKVAGGASSEEIPSDEAAGAIWRGMESVICVL